MDNHENDTNERRNSNTEYQPTKCRVTKPPPPKPATNPMQFVKVAPCPLFQKAQEQIKKVEEIKKERKEVREEIEDWQLNLDNWKSSRRKRQEHIIERVVEVKKLEQEGQEKSRRKGKTFSEMREDRRHKIKIPVYDEDSNDLSDYGIGSSSSKTNSIKDVDTDDNISMLDEKEQSVKDSLSTPNQSQSEDEAVPTSKQTDSKNNNTTEQYTYEGIQDYRSRIQSKIHVDDSIFTKNKDSSKSKEFSEAQTVLPKGEIFKRKEIFEGDKTVEIGTFESNTSRRLSEDFANTRSIKDRLKSLEQSVDQTLRSNDKNDIQVSVKQRMQNFNKQNELDNQNNNAAKPNKISSYLVDIPTFESKSLKEDRCSSPETELYMNKLNMFNQDLDNLMNGKHADNGMDDCSSNSNYPPSTSSVELTGISSDREDSGIHTADVSCSVSQADEPIDTDSETIPNCIEKLAKETEMMQIEEDIRENEETQLLDTKEMAKSTEDLLEELRKDSSEHLTIEREAQLTHIKELSLNVPEESENEEILIETKQVELRKKPVEYENVEISPAIYENVFISNNTVQPVDYLDSDLIIMSTTLKEPPKVKPPPPPPMEEEEEGEKPMKRINSTKRIKKEIHLKRSSFLGLEEPLDNIEPDVLLEKPPDITAYLQKDLKMEKSLYKKMHEDRMGNLSKVESQDSGLDIDRGRLSSDTWCSSTPSHERQDSEQTNSITSEEDEITKKEREIIEMVEKEEKSRDPNLDGVNNEEMSSPKEAEPFEPSLGSEQFKNPYFPQQSSDLVDDQDSEVLKVEQELRQLEREELERQRENLLFRESRAKARMQNNRHSLENICDESYPGVDYRKSMPELQQIPLEYRKSVPDVPNVYRSIPDLDVQYNTRQSMPDIQHMPAPEQLLMGNRKSMPELQLDMDVHRSAFKTPTYRQPILPGKPIEPKIFFNPISPEHNQVKPKQLSKHNLHALSAAPRPRRNDNWIQPKPKSEKSYSQHWLIQEAELRRISDQQKNAFSNRNNWQPQPPSRHEKHLPDSIIHSLTQRVQNRTNINERNPQIRRPDQNEFMQPYIANPPQTMGHAMPMSYPPMAVEENQDRVLSVSGKKKCSYCGSELGRGAAMIIESLCLFYHMECFKCCVCRMQLGDGRMGTDVRVRNQKLHCQNCYSSDDGVKFSCV
ncbi:unnamed protein product [Brassicogethes aeneus]|uniref:LIM zinc-binding domain-containing protein n=1 Tax=Brassicogethes aeneus TaxID=1431903 RepID=A0A9P0BH28_BRAAE|nr:unnamed protein product [Brassicogethes aeneus]